MQSDREPPVSRLERPNGRSARERLSGFAHQGLLAAIVALALCAGAVVVEHGAPEVDASAARQSLEVLDAWLSLAMPVSVSAKGAQLGS